MPDGAYVQIDGIQVPVTAARALTSAIRHAFPAGGDTEDALAAAIAEAWTSWAAEWPIWTGSGEDLLRSAAAPHRPPPLP